MSRWRSIALVARREILERGRSRGFILSVLFTTMLVVGSIVVPAIFLNDDKPTPVGVVQPAPAALEPAIARPRRSSIARSRCDVSRRESAAAALEDGTVAAVVTVPPDLSESGHHPGQGPPGPGPGPAPGERRHRVSGPSPSSDAARGRSDRAHRRRAATGPERAHPQTDADQAKFIVANIGAVLILVGIFSFGFTVLTGVVEEKQSRVVEVVLSTVRPRDLLMGKVLGIGILGLVQLLVFVVAAFVAASLVSRVTLPTTTPGAIGLLALWFILGYTLYRRRSASSARWRRGWRRPRTRRRRSR